MSNADINKMTYFYGYSWVDTHDGEVFSENVLFAKKSDCLKLSEYATVGFHKIAEVEEHEVTSYIDECHMRYLPKGSQDYDGEGSCYLVCEKGRGATEYLFARV